MCHTCLPIPGSVVRNLMLYEVKGVNGEDLRVKAHPLHRYLIRDLINLQINSFFFLQLCITFLFPFVVTNVITNCRTYLWGFSIIALG